MHILCEIHTGHEREVERDNNWLQTLYKAVAPLLLPIVYTTLNSPSTRDCCGNHFAPSNGSICLLAADYDLTGQILWPAAHLLTSFLAANPNTMAGRRGACELGSGLGLVGILCGQYCDTGQSTPMHQRKACNPYQLQQNLPCLTQKHFCASRTAKIAAHCQKVAPPLPEIGNDQSRHFT